MFSSWKVGRVAGIDLYLHPTFFLLLAVAYLLDGGLMAVAFTAAIFGCVLLHEYGHALTARRYGIATRDITLYPIGGVARLERMPRAPGAELLITLAGPATNLAIAAGLGLVLGLGMLLEPGGEPTLVGRFAQMLMVVNVLLAVFNLIPAFPMDGGRVLRALLSAGVGRLRATEVAAGVGQALALAIPLTLMYLGLFNPLHLVLAAFLFIAAGREREQVRAEEAERRRPNVEPAGVWTAPPGFCWVSLGDGSWRLAPIAVRVVPREGRSPYGRVAEASPWIRFQD